ncbi:MAG: sugar phosphate isomerase/epimerase [Clostridia bacterium]|nr:sugar phosphate isomerase/epimerase [Clostridia bacterium]
MAKQKLCLGLIARYGQTRLGAEEETRLLAETGFDGFFSGWSGKESLAEYRRLAGETGLFYQSVHAPFSKVRDIWHGEKDDAESALGELTRCLEDCAACDVPITVCHAFIGFEDHSPNEAGVARFERLVRRAAQVGVKIAFENTEGTEYLDAVMEMAAAYPQAAGFCWDTGHEKCYNRSQDMPGRYPGKLIATHINDNLGVSDPGGKITWLDDLHLLPFDGTVDWENAARRLKDFDGPLTFELTTLSKPGRHDNDKYAALSPRGFLAEAYARAQKFSEAVRLARNEGRSK